MGFLGKIDHRLVLLYYCNDEEIKRNSGSGATFGSCDPPHRARLSSPHNTTKDLIKGNQCLLINDTKTIFFFLQPHGLHCGLLSSQAAARIHTESTATQVI